MGGRVPGARLARAALLLSLPVCHPPWAGAEEPAWRLEAALGAAHSLGSTLKVASAGMLALELEAEWDNRSFESPLYYGLRVARADAHGAWALRFVHLKIFLAKPPPEIERFSVSHGYNLLTLERSFPVRGFDLVAGFGLVIAHPEVILRHQTARDADQGRGYSVTGPTGALALGRRLRLGERFALVPEIRFTLSRAHVPIADGEASVPNASLHVLVGLELRL